jgi:hypothetical protein
VGGEEGRTRVCMTKNIHAGDGWEKKAQTTNKDKSAKGEGRGAALHQRLDSTLHTKSSLLCLKFFLFLFLLIG